MTTTTRYFCNGDVRSDCGHAHRSIGAALACLQRDQRACGGLPGGSSYSDRHVVRTDGEPLSEAELVELEDADSLAAGDDLTQDAQDAGEY